MDAPGDEPVPPAFCVGQLCDKCSRGTLSHQGACSTDELVMRSASGTVLGREVAKRCAQGAGSAQENAEQAALVNLEGPQEDFQGAVMAGMRVLVAALESRVAGSLQARP